MNTAAYWLWRKLKERIRWGCPLDNDNKKKRCCCQRNDGEVRGWGIKGQRSKVSQITAGATMVGPAVGSEGVCETAAVAHGVTGRRRSLAARPIDNLGARARLAVWQNKSLSEDFRNTNRNPEQEFKIVV